MTPDSSSLSPTCHYINHDNRSHIPSAKLSVMLNSALIDGGFPWPGRPISAWQMYFPMFDTVNLLIMSSTLVLCPETAGTPITISCLLTTASASRSHSTVGFAVNPVTVVTVQDKMYSLPSMGWTGVRLCISTWLHLSGTVMRRQGSRRINTARLIQRVPTYYNSDKNFPAIIFRNVYSYVFIIASIIVKLKVCEELARNAQ